MREKTSYGERSSIEKAKSEYRKFLIFTEGQVTEIDYFKGLKEFKKELDISDIIKIEPEKRPRDKSGWSNISKIIEFIEIKKKESEIDNVEFLKENDQLWIVFDRDQITSKQYHEALEYARENDYHLAFTNSCFELWLLLHFDNIDEYSLDELKFSNDNKNNIVSEVIRKSHNGLYGKNKKKVRFSCFKGGITKACEQSTKLNNDLEDLFDNVGTTMHSCLKEIINY
jgi:hypothetical protein